MPESKGGRVAAMVVAFVLFAAGVAWALFALLGGITGEVTQGAWALRLGTGSESANAPAPSTIQGTCDVARLSVTSGGVQGQIDLDWTAVSPGDECVVEVSYHPPTGTVNSTDLRLQDVLLPEGLAADLGADCGAVVPANSSASSAARVTFSVIVEEGAASTIILDPLTDAVQWVRAQDFQAGLC